MKKIIFALSLLLLCSCSYLDVVPDGKAPEEDNSGYLHPESGG